MAAPDFAANHLALEPVLIDHLRASVPALLEVGGPAEFDRALLAGDEENPPVYPAAYCLYAGPQPGKPLGSSGTGRLIEQVWQVVIQAKPALDDDRTAQAHPGTVLASVLRAMSAFRPEGVARVMEVQAGDEPVIYADGQVYFVLAYQFDFQL